MCVVWEVVNLVVSLLFANSFQISRRTSSGSTALLLDGLKNAPHPLIREQALFELHQLLMKEPAERQRMFREFVGDTPASRMVVQWLVKTCKEHNEKIKQDLDLLCQVEAALSSTRASPKAASEEPIVGQDSSIFAQKETTIVGLVRRFIKPSASRESATVKAEGGVPAVLAMKRAALLSIDSAQQPPASTAKESWLSKHARSLVAWPAGRYFAGFLVQYYRNRTIDRSCHLLVWVVESLGQLCVVSYEEDSLGQVQFQLDAAFSVLLEHFFLLLHLNAVLRPEDTVLVPEVRLTEDSEQAFARLVQAAAQAIEAVEKVFGEALLDEQRGLLSAATRTSLERFRKLA